jgi:hypothetical protein
MKCAWATIRARAVAIGLVVLLVGVAAAPVEASWRVGFWVGLGFPYGWPYGHAPYPYPYYAPYYYPHYPYYAYPYAAPYPVYVYPPPAASVPPAAAPATPTTPTPSPLTPSPPAAGEGATAQKCETVWVEGHYETHVGPGGQASTVWVPGASRQICQDRPGP